MVVAEHLIARPRLTNIPDKHISAREQNKQTNKQTHLSQRREPYLLLQLFSFGSKAHEKRGWPGRLGLAVVPWLASILVFTVVVGLAVTLLVVGVKVVVLVVVVLVVVLLGFAVVF